MASVLVAVHRARALVVIVAILVVTERAALAMLVMVMVTIMVAVAVEAIVTLLALTVELRLALAFARPLQFTFALEARETLLVHLALPSHLRLPNPLQTPLALDARGLGGAIAARRRRTDRANATRAIGLLHALLLTIDHATIQDAAIHDPTVPCLTSRRVDAALSVVNPIAERALLARST